MKNITLKNTYEVLLQSGDIAKISLEDLLQRSEKTLLYIYPKDNTPGCTIENKDFTCLKEKFQALGIRLLGISKDSIASHEKFVAKQELGVDLLSDPDLILHKELEAYGEKTNYGRKYLGVIRSTFLIDAQGNVLHSRKNVRAKGHAERVLKMISDKRSSEE